MLTLCTCENCTFFSLSINGIESLGNYERLIYMLTHLYLGNSSDERADGCIPVNICSDYRWSVSVHILSFRNILK